MPKLSLIMILACLFVPGRFSLHVPEDPQDPAGPQNSEEPRGRGFQNFEDAPDLPGPENLEAHQDVSGSPEQDPQSPDETQDLNSSTKQGLENQRENQDLSDSLVNKGWAEPEGPASCGELGGGEDCVDYNLADDEVLLGFDNGDGPACGSNEYLEAGECVQCPVCGIGQKLSEPCGGGYDEPSMNLQCIDCPPDHHSKGQTHFCDKCTDCSLLYRDVITPCTPGNNTVCSPVCWEGYEVHNVTLLNGIVENMFACKKKIGSGFLSLSKVLGGFIGVTCFGVAVCCWFCFKRRDRQVATDQPDEDQSDGVAGLRRRQNIYRSIRH